LLLFIAWTPCSSLEGYEQINFCKFNKTCGRCKENFRFNVATPNNPRMGKEYVNENCIWTGKSCRNCVGESCEQYKNTSCPLV